MKKTRIVIFIALFLFACRKENTNSHLPPPPSNSTPVTVNFDESVLGDAISPNFEGLSYETGILAGNPEILNANNTVLVQLIKNLGPGLLRIGGDSSDETFWTGTTRNTLTGPDSLTTSDVDRLAAFSKAIGWPVLFGLNLGKNDPAAAANEAQYAYNKLGDNLLALQAGNEPDVYHLFGLRNPNYAPPDYMPEFENYFSAIRSVAPQTSFIGPGIAYNTDWISAFAAGENARIKMLDAHYYIAGPASDPTINYHTLLTSSYKLANVLSELKNAAVQYHLPYRITECNSIYGGGKAGVSDVFASALWALDFMWTVATNSGDGVNFHGGNGLIYSPVTIEGGVITARPVYYAMLAFKYATKESKVIITTTNHPEYNCSAYACLNSDGARTVTLINKDDSSDFYFTINTGRTISSVQISRLTAPGVESATGITFSGSKVNDDGTFKPAAPASYIVSKNTFSVNVPATSAAVITLQ
jgi:hypothetical protein